MDSAFHSATRVRIVFLGQKDYPKSPSEL